ncbi:pyridoxamine 5'-phosphate oxidase family protein [Candidatus Saccharibacteria bacterium]|nr:MAG: pyridoxamine 5'-phosphate oxidase family protein [Candidatus Saccharibacteria bacterium]
MKTVEEQVREYLKAHNVLQLATASSDGQPWVCNVHYYSDDGLNIYWISTPDRRHSLEIAANPKVAAVIKVHENTPEEDYVIGVSVEGTAELLGTSVLPEIIDAYCKKQSKKPETQADLHADKAPFKFYKFTPISFVVFNTKDFKGDPRREWKLGE